MDFEEWRNRAREALSSRIEPSRMYWQEEATLFSSQPVVLTAEDSPIRCPALFLNHAKIVACHRDADRWDLLYEILWRITFEQPALMHDAADPSVRKLDVLYKQVRRDMHKMTAFVRFEKVNEDPEAFFAWYEPDHHILRATAPFFEKRFSGMNWALATPDGGVSWDRRQLRFVDGPLTSPNSKRDPYHDMWRTYFSATFNPARLKTKMMKREMPVRFWKNLPEAELIPEMIAGATKRAQVMVEQSQAETPAPAMPIAPTVEGLREQVKACQSCDLCASGRPGVPSIGPDTAGVMIVGEQPGDQEDLQGKPFVGPAGKLLRDLLAELGINTQTIYFTNAVKHFRFQWRGKVRVHQRPSNNHIKSCRPYLVAELQKVDPKLVICLGNSALQGTLGYALPITEARLRHDLRTPAGTRVCAMVHPSAVLRAQPELQAQMREQLKQDLARAFSSDANQYSPHA